MDRINLQITDEDISLAYNELGTLLISDGLGQKVLSLVGKWTKKLVSTVVQFFKTLGVELGKLIARAIKMIGLIPTLDKEPKQTKESPLVKKLQERYYLIEEKSINRLIEDIQAGRKSEKQIRAIANQYGNLSNWVEHLKERERLQNKYRGLYAIRLLDQGVKEHCMQCPQYAAYGLVRADVLPLPTERCECRLNCRCSILFFPTIEKAVSELKRRKIKGY